MSALGGLVISKANGPRAKVLNLPVLADDDEVLRGVHCQIGNGKVELVRFERDDRVLQIRVMRRR